MKKVLVLDFGGQYNLLVARRVRECGVYCEIRSWRESMENIRAFQPDALIFTGGPATVFEPNAPMVDPALFSMGIPVLGICYGQQLMIHLLGGQCRRADTREYGKVELTHNGKSPLFKDIPATAVYWMSHGVEVETLAPGFEVVASTDGCRCAAIQCAEKQLYGVQFHPEVLHTAVRQGACCSNFLYGVCGCTGEWTMGVLSGGGRGGDAGPRSAAARVLLALSGGVDSSVAAALLQRAVGNQLTCIFVDHGLLRKNEGDRGGGSVHDPLGPCRRSSGSTPRTASSPSWPASPTRRPSARSSARSSSGSLRPRPRRSARVDYPGTGYHLSRCNRVRSWAAQSVVIKSHHNVGGLPDCVDFKDIVEPLRRLFKDEVRQLGHRTGPAGAAGVAPALPRPRSGHPCHR